MTEARVAYQVSMFGGEVVADDVVMRCRDMLASVPSTREDYEVAWLTYLVRYHDLPAIAALQVEACLKKGAPSFRTVANRIQELMRADADLQPPREVMEYRQKQRRQGRIR